MSLIHNTKRLLVWYHCSEYSCPNRGWNWWCKEQLLWGTKHVFDKFPTYHMKILLQDFSAKVGRGDVFKSTIKNESLRGISNDNTVRIEYFAASKYLIVKSTMFPLRNILKFTWISSDGKTCNQINHILIDRRRPLSVGSGLWYWSPFGYRRS
jgi:hypothetical protein